ncbi:MAG TPA: MG2 domain-containing protein, partial [Phaeodactylibacter sp.]|nr:MG2 domain-containing protein [Phaeodactylibacter sp.]
DRMQQAYEDSEEVTQVLYNKAELYRQWGNRYSPNEDTTHRWKLRDAADLCLEAIDMYPESYGAKRCKVLLAQLQRPEAGLQAEAINLPDEPLLMALRYRNMDQIHFRLVRLTAEERMQYESQSYQEALSSLKQKKRVRDWSAEIPDEGDLQQHRIELPIASLPLGNYALLFAENARFKSNGNTPQGLLYFAVSEMGYLFSQDQERILLAHRAEGQPLSGVEVTFYRFQYNARRREREQVKLYTDESDEQGFVASPTQDKYASYAHLVRGEDELIIRNVPTNYTSNYSNQRREKRTLFFLDRAIYRPGQAVYFKVLTLAVDEDGVPSVLPNEPVDITFNDANGEKVEALSFKTNPYGTANGVFTAPAGGLLGRMHLKSSVGNSRHSFYVEEYKRPKFEVKIDPLAGSPQLGDTITVEGVAEAYAGSSVSDSEVSYRVVRQVRYPWWPWWRSMPNFGSSQEMAAGTATTDADGRFAFEFLARPDESVPREQRPQFNYTIYVDVTDQNGETRSATRSVNLAYLSVKADMMLPDAVDRADESFRVGLVTQNLDGEPLPKQVELEVHRLDAPGRYQRKRYWTLPDYQYLDEAAFGKQFPQYAYQQPPEPQYWPVGEELLTSTVSTGEQDSLLINCKDWAVGYYRLRLVVEDESGERVEVSKFVMIYDQAAEALPPTVMHWPRLSKPTPYLVGEELAAHLATGQEEALPFLFELERRNELSGTAWESSSPWHTFRYEIQEKDRGGIYLHYAGMRYNRAFTEAIRIEVPWREKKLDISYRTFRDKLKPGQQETWSMVISGPDKDKVAAELVATLYDASLDA